MTIFLTKKDVEVLLLIKKYTNNNKSFICKKSKYLYGNLQHTFIKLENEELISIVKTTKSIVSITIKGCEVANRL
jgi:hypothetical protein